MRKEKKTKSLFLSLTAKREKARGPRLPFPKRGIHKTGAKTHRAAFATATGLRYGFLAAVPFPPFPPKRGTRKYEKGEEEEANNATSEKRNKWFSRDDRAEVMIEKEGGTFCLVGAGPFLPP